MSLQSFVNDIFQGLIAHTWTLHIALVIGVETRDCVLEDFVAVGNFVNVTHDAVHPPPDSVTAIEPRVSPSVEQVGNEAVPEASSVTCGQMTMDSPTDCDTEISQTSRNLPRMMYLASWNLPVAIKSPLRAMKVSLPQLRMYPEEKWGRPAATVGVSATPKSGWTVGIGSERFGDMGGRSADLRMAVCCTDPSARYFMKLEPF